MYISRFLSQTVYLSQTTFEFLMAFSEYAISNLSHFVSLGHVKKLRLIFSYNGLTMKRVLVSIKFCFREILGQTVWTKVRLRPSQGFLELGRKAVYCQGAWEQGLNFEELHDFPACV